MGDAARRLARELRSEHRGFLHDDLCIREGPLGLGVFSKALVRRGTLVASLPLPFLLSSDMGQRLLVSGGWCEERALPELPAESYLAVCLALHVSGCSQARAAYLASLPSCGAARDALPLLWNTETCDAARVDAFVESYGGRGSSARDALEAEIFKLQGDATAEYGQL